MPRSSARTALFAGLLLLTAPAAAQVVAPPDSARLALARELVVLTRSTEQALTTMDAMLTSQRTLNPKIPAAFWDRFGKRMHDDKDEFTTMLATVYARHFSLEELRGLLAFNRSALGQRVIALQAQISQESMDAGRAWGARVGAEVGQELADEGIPIEN